MYLLYEGYLMLISISSVVLCSCHTNQQACVTQRKLCL